MLIAALIAIAAGDALERRARRLSRRRRMAVVAGSAGLLGRRRRLGSGRQSLEAAAIVSVVRCDEAAWRFLGLSLAGYNVLISLALAAVAAWGLADRRPEESALPAHSRLKDGVVRSAYVAGIHVLTRD